MLLIGRPARRAGYTFVELLMVIAIIAVLAALLLGGVQKVLALQARTEAMSEITKMAAALEQAKAAYDHIDYLPSRLVLHSNVAVYRDENAAPEVKRTAQVFRKMFGRRFLSNGTAVNWGVPDGTVLSGSECLVFYLGGMPGSGRMDGFSTDPVNPTKPGGERKGPFYEFRWTRLVPGPHGRPHYLDPWGTPYAYFGPNWANAYDPTHAQTFTTKNGTSTVAPYGGGSNWINPKSFQIISAGRNLVFGPGGTSWDPSTGYGELNPGGDDLANFSSIELSDPQQ